MEEVWCVWGVWGGGGVCFVDTTYAQTICARLQG